MSAFPLVCRLWFDPPASGPWNMAVDDLLLEAAGRGLASLRFYQWAPATLSLGYFQRSADRRHHVASGNCPLVRRASGGGAIVHDTELTYSLALPDRWPGARHSADLYSAVHSALVDALAAELGLAATRYDFAGAAEGNLSRDRSRAVDEPFLCFQRRAMGDVIADGWKICGSAQRRAAGALLQHGSLLLRRSPACPELPGIEELIGRPVDCLRLRAAWCRRIARQLNLCLVISPRKQYLTAPEVEQRIRSRYTHFAWTDRR